MVSGRLFGWGTARSTLYSCLEGSGCDSECAPRSTCTKVSLVFLGVGQGPRQIRVPPPPNPFPGLFPTTTHTCSRQCAALSTHCSVTRKPPHTCVPFTCTEAM